MIFTLQGIFGVRDKKKFRVKLKQSWIFLDSSWSEISSEDPGDEDRREKRRQTTDADDVVGVGAVALVTGADADVHVPAVVDRLVAGGVTVLSIRNGDIRQVAGNYKVAFSPRQISHWLHFLLG